jgi:UDP-N-acetyl-D-mannosaminuronic acid dehydrogenase
VFATETLALGINMPARTVVIEKLDKWNGETHANLTAGEYTQLTGRAGRRGIDVEGHAVVLWQPGMDPGAVAGLASTRTYPLNSSFRPSYNMAVNLTGYKTIDWPGVAVGYDARDVMRDVMGAPVRSFPGGLPQSAGGIAVTNLPDQTDRDVVVIGGCGHVGLPLALAFADRGANVGIHDISQTSVDMVNVGRLPFAESGADEVLHRVLSAGRLEASADPAIVATAENVVVVIGTPVDEHLNPKQTAITKALGACADYLRDGQLLILRSTVFPGVTALVEKMVARLGLDIEVAFCPERIAEGKAMTELFELPQIVSSRTAAGTKRASALFGRLTGKLVVMSPEEAELAKLFTNVWRYIKFATANQLYMMANEQGLDFDRIRRGLAEDYPRAADMPAAGFAAGPCLFKDTMQLAAFNHNNFPLGHAAMAVNEGLPLYVVHRLEERFDLASMTVGILGMAFKAGSDDIRSSLSYKLKRILQFKADAVLCTDPYVTVDPNLLPLDEVLARSDLLVVGAPHSEYRGLVTDKPAADIWDVLGNGVRV